MGNEEYKAHYQSGDCSGVGTNSENMLALEALHHFQECQHTPPEQEQAGNYGGKDRFHAGGSGFSESGSSRISGAGGAMQEGMSDEEGN
jgi:hypothetical protein